MEKELNTLKEQNTFRSVPNPNNIKPIKTRWVFKIKEDNNNNILEFKARFVAKGFEQLYGIDYIETFAGVIKQVAWKLIFALAAINKWHIYKADAISAFTQGNSDTTLYISQPEGFINNNQPDNILLLNKALYGLKQSARIWYITLTTTLKTLGFKALPSEECVFINKDINIIICIYVDDMAIIGPKESDIKDLINKIKEHFNIKDLGPIKDYLGIDINYQPNKGILKMSLGTYINKVLNRFNFINSRSTSLPMDPKLKLEANKGQASKEDIKWYQSALGCLLYITLAIRPDIAYSVIKLSRFASNPSQDHIIGIKRILRYLSNNKDIGITYNIAKSLKQNNNHFISGYSDSDYGGDLINYKSTTGYIFLLAGGPISWKSKLQPLIAQSTTEAEYIAINTTIKEAIYLKALLDELGYYKQNKFPIYTDNNGALLLAQNAVFHERTKHIAIKYHFIRDLISKGIIDLGYIPTNNNKADGLTKALEKNKFKDFLDLNNLRDIKDKEAL